MRVQRATVRVETVPGRQLQREWAEHRPHIAGQETVVHFLVNTLGFSRRFHCWCTDRAAAEQWLRDEADQRCHGPVPDIVAERVAREAPT